MHASDHQHPVSGRVSPTRRVCCGICDACLLIYLFTYGSTRPLPPSRVCVGVVYFFRPRSNPRERLPPSEWKLELGCFVGLKRQSRQAHNSSRVTIKTRMGSRLLLLSKAAERHCCCRLHSSSQSLDKARQLCVCSLPKGREARKQSSTTPN